MKIHIASLALAFFVFPVISAGMAGDTLSLYHIDEVTVVQPRVRFFQEDRKVTEADSLALSLFYDDDLGNLLRYISPAYINVRGGNGSASGLTLRGTNSYQTTVKWNGFTLNSLTLGSADLSIIPVESMESVAVVHGSSGTVSGSGSFGGSVELRNKPDWDNSLSINATSGYGSFSSKRASVSARAGNKKIQYHLNFFRVNALNDFSYTDVMKPGNPEETIVHNSLENTGIIQNLFVRLSHNQNIEAGLWYQSKTKEIPAIMGSYTTGNAVQRDSVIRGYVNWSLLMERSRLTLSSSVMDEYMFYRVKQPDDETEYSVNSSIRGRKFMNEFDYRLYLSNMITLDAGASYNNMEADVESYNGTVSEYQSALFSGLRLNYKGIVSNITLRKEFHPEISIPLLFSAGVRYAPQGKEYVFRMSYSDQFRLPTFNDKYWRPGGNPSLLPESGQTIDGGMEFSRTVTDDLHLKGEAGLYHSRIRNMIQWVPAGSYWAPRNSKEVHINGAELSLSSTYSIRDYRLRFDGSYSYSMPSIRDTYEEETGLEGNMPEYVPAHSGSGRLSLLNDKGHAAVSFNYTGSRYTTRDNNPLYKMPPFALINLHLGYSIELQQDLETSLQFRIMNLFDRKYQVVRAYPMPGRSLQASLIVRFSR